VKFTEKGSVTLEHRTQLVNGQPCMEFSVTDTGIGIRPDDKAKLFQAFAQVDPKRRGEGTGLGLHLSQKLAELIGARIEFESEYGKGSRFALIVAMK
jgi:protein-histidine pros-kinase